MTKKKYNISEKHPQDLAYELELLTPEEFLDTITFLINDGKLKYLAEVFECLENDYLGKTLILHDVQNYISIFNQMPANEIVDFIRVLPPEKKIEIISLIDIVKAHDVRELYQYDSEYAAGIMEKEFFYIREKFTVDKCFTYLSEQSHLIKNINYIYVVDNDMKLLGVVGLKELLIAEKNLNIKEIMHKNVKTVNVSDSLMKAASIIKDYDFFFLPVVNNQEIIQGIVLVDDIIDYFVKTSGNQLEQIVGLDLDDEEIPVLKEIFYRAPSLLFLLIFSLFNVTVYNSFSSVTSDPTIVLFQALIAGMTGNVATQTLALSIKRLARNDFNDQNIMFYLKNTFKQIKIYFGISLIIGLSLAIFVGFIYGDYILALTLILSIVLSFAIASMTGSLIPVIITKMKFNSAIASGPIISTINDLFSISVYFFIANLLIN